MYPKQYTNDNKTGLNNIRGTTSGGKNLEESVYIATTEIKVT